MTARSLPAFVPALALILAACSSGEDAVPGDSDDTRPWSGIGPDEIVQFTGTEPFWRGSVSGSTLTYVTMERPEGRAIAVDRFAGRGGVSWSGELEGEGFTLAVSPGECSDGMSPLRYPFTVMLEVGGETRTGCAWSERNPFDEPADLPGAAG